MPKTYFNINKTSSLKDLKKGAHIYLIGICGVAMGQLAASLQKSGFQVSGSDKAFYEPMSSFLKDQELLTFEGFDKNNITSKIDLVVIGNSVSYENPEVLAVENLKIPYTCFPKLLAELIIADRKSIVVSGTHGKTTTSSLISQSLINMQERPSYFIGGVVSSLPTSLMSGEKISVVEGDEYDSAFFAKVPKFNFYQADVCIINAVEFDHADIYQDIEQINNEFNQLVASLSKDNTLIVCLDFENLTKLNKAWETSAKCKIITFGSNSHSDYRIVERIYKDQQQIIKVQGPEEVFELSIALTGLFNARNALAGYLALKASGYTQDQIIQSFQKIIAPKRRQEVLLENEAGLLIIEDFAHHPTSVKENLLSLKEKYPKKCLVAVFEPASNTSRRKVFEKDFAMSLSVADEVIILKPLVLEEEAFDPEKVCEIIREEGKIASYLDSSEKIAEYLKDKFTGDTTISLMSNGSFQGLREKILQKNL